MQKGTRTHHPRGQKISSETPPVSSKRWNQEQRVNESFKQNTDDDDDDDEEVVKYMSKLPSYLQGEEECCNVLNVGVLDWARLEKWKQHGRAQRSVCCKRDTKVSSTLGTVPNASSSSHQYHHLHRCKIDDQVHASSLLGKVKASRTLQHSSAHQLRCTLEPEFASSDSLLYKQQIAATCGYNKSSRKGRRSTSGLLPEMGNSVGSLGAKGNLVVVPDKKKESDKRAAGEIHARASERWKQKFDGEEKTVGDSNAGGLTCEKQEEVTNIFLLPSRKQSQSTLSGEPQMPSSLDDNLKVTRCSLPFSDGISSSLGLRSQVPRSCPLSFDLERDSEDMMRLPLGVDLSCKQERSGGTTRHSKRIVDQEKKRDPSSPSKRFSFSFGRLSRNFTFKEAADSSAVGQPLTSSLDDTSKRCDGPSQSSNPDEKHCGSRVSPLRRLLDHPLLKSKGSDNVLPSKEERSTSSSNPKPINMDEKKQQQQKTWRTQALFQLTTRNGIPLFQFVVDDDNSRSILGATMKSSASSFKDDSVQYCTFYSVDEVKKKKSRSWLIHGHKEKQQHRFVYNVIGQMRLCNSSMNSDITDKKSENVSTVIRESVLVDETEQVKGRKEVAAVVIKKKHAEENMNALGETIVIIPGGVHSFPEKGAPTPLVTRWRSAGLCDCGGWDVGCKLHVLSNKTLLHELDQSFKLFDQEESDQDKGPVLAMTELKTGMYRVEFGSFLSHLQAFFVCVTVITCASEEKTVSKTTGRSTSPFAPPLSPVGRV